MSTSSFVIALIASGLTLNEMLNHADVFASVVVATTAGFIFGFLAQSVI
jgi:hypothetical protein